MDGDTQDVQFTLQHIGFEDLIVNLQRNLLERQFSVGKLRPSSSETAIR